MSTLKVTTRSLTSSTMSVVRIGDAHVDGHVTMLPFLQPSVKQRGGTCVIARGSRPQGLRLREGDTSPRLDQGNENGALTAKSFARYHA